MPSPRPPPSQTPSPLTPRLRSRPSLPSLSTHATLAPRLRACTSLPSAPCRLGLLRPPHPSAASSTPRDPSPSSSAPMVKISVSVRFRQTAPASSDDSSTSGGDYEWRINNTRISLLHHAAPVPGASFAFDHVFDETATNARIYGVLVLPLILAAVDGFNGTAFAYGQTSSGKTFTMNGSGDHPGIIPLAVHDIFDTARESFKEALTEVRFHSALEWKTFY